MAKQKSGYLGGFSGKLGPAVGYMWNGKWCVRSHQPMVRNPRTKAQVAHREMFKQEVQLAAKMRWAVTTALRDVSYEAGMTSYNLFVKLNQAAFGFAEGRLTVDYPSLLLSVGNVAPVTHATAALQEGNVLTVNYRVGDGSGFDHVYLYVYAPESGSGFLSAPAYRRDRKIQLALPDELAGCELHAWLMVSNADGRWSESVYVEVPEEQGEMSVEATGEVVSAAAEGVHFPTTRIGREHHGSRGVGRDDDVPLEAGSLAPPVALDTSRD